MAGREGSSSLTSAARWGLGGRVKPWHSCVAVAEAPKRPEIAAMLSKIKVCVNVAS